MHGNAYYRVEVPITLLAAVGMSPSNTYIGSSRSITNVHEPTLLSAGAEIHNLNGAAFAVTAASRVLQLSPGEPPHLFESNTGAQSWMGSLIRGLAAHGYLAPIVAGRRPRQGYGVELPRLADHLPHRRNPAAGVMRTTPEIMLQIAIETALESNAEAEADDGFRVTILPPTSDHVAQVEASFPTDAGGNLRLRFGLSRDLSFAVLGSVVGADGLPMRPEELRDRVGPARRLPMLGADVDASPEAAALRGLVSELVTGVTGSPRP